MKSKREKDSYKNPVIAIYIYSLLLRLPIDLVKIAKTNSSFEVRKSAIYSLGNSDDERALDALIDLAKK